jgi:dTDP-4-dehydrorhamnose reductase
LYGALLARTPINVFDDVMFSPLALGTLCDCIERCIVERPLGVFNLGSRDGMSKADFSFAFAEATGLPTTNLLRYHSRTAAKLAAHRPTDMRMLCERFEHHMRLTLPSLIDEIKVLAHDYR